MKRATIIYFCGSQFTYISIHALVKRATDTVTLVIVGVPISIHALMKRATDAIIRR